MNTITRSLARYIALPIVSAGIIGGAALGMAGVAGAATSPSGSSNFHAPTTHATPAHNPVPGVRAWREFHHYR